MKRRILSIITALALCLSLCPTWALAAEADPSLCKHHPEHTEDCGYTAPTEGHDCGHEHTAECYTLGVLPDGDSGDPYEIGGDTENLLNCQHSHNSECGYVQADPGAPCGYVCRICPIEDLIAALPEQVTEDNAADVRGQLDHILDLYRELDEGEQEEINLSRIYALQGALDAANDPDMIEGEVSVTYQEASWNGSEVTYTGKTENCTSVEGSTEAVTWNAGWYVVNSTVTISEPITVTGAVNLILADDCTLDAQKGIVVTTDNSLTIYAQSGGTGTLNATGTTDSSNNASAGIGGSTASVDSGTITIHGGVINAIGGVSSFGDGAAGIGGGTVWNGNGGSSGTVTIYGGTVTANSGAGNITGAGIGGGGGAGAGGTSSNITIYGGSVTAASTGTQSGGAGIGGGGGNNGGTGSNIQIYGGTINATGSEGGAGIGGGGGGIGGTSGAGTNITISGGIVTAVGGTNAAGIGGGGGYSTQYSSCTGGAGSVTITGGIVDAKGGAGNSSGDYAGDPIGNGGNTTATATVDKTNGIVFENGAGTVCGDVTLDGSYTVPGDYTLNIPVGASLSGSGTLSGGGTFTTENLTVDMISVPSNLYYDGKDRTEYLTTELSGELDKGVTICGQTFAVCGWTLAVEKTDDLHYTATYTNNNDNTKTVQKTITLLQSGTDLTDGEVKTYNGDTLTTSFSAGDTITVKATPTATGKAPDNSAMFAASFTAPTAGQMAVFVGDTQVSAPVGAVDGSYTMTVSAADVLLAAGGPGTGITLTAKFVGNDNMADGAGTVTVSITAAAKAEKGGAVIGYYGESNLASAFAAENTGATVTLLKDVDLGENDLMLRSGTFTLDCGAFTLSSSSEYFVIKLDNADFTFAGGTIQCNGTGNAVFCATGAFTMTGGTLNAASDYALNCAYSGEANIQGGTVGTQGKGLCINNPNTVKLSGGTYATIYIVSNYGAQKVPLSTILADGRAAYGPDGPITRDTVDAELTGPIIVKECEHDGVTVQDQGNGKHGLDCPYCGYHYEHTTALTATASGNNVTLNGGCGTEGCNYAAELGTVSFTFENLVYGNPDAKVSWIKGGPTALGVMLKIDNALNYVVQSEEATHSCSLTNPNAEAGTPVTAKPHTMKVSFYDDGSIIGTKTVECELTFTVAPAPLTPSITGTATKPYDGTTDAPAGLAITLTGVVGSDDVTATASYAYDTANAGTNKTITASGITLEGDGKDNYTLSSTTASAQVGTITKADQAAPHPPTAADANIKDTSITLNTIENAEYSKDGTTWQASPTFIGLDPNTAYTFYARLKADDNHNASPNSPGASITTRKMMLGNATVTVSGSYTYTGAAQRPAVAVVKNGKALTAGTDYTVSYANNTNAGTATVTITGMGDYEGTNSTTFTIQRKTLTVAGAIAVGRPYNGTNTVTITGVTLEGVVNGDAVSVDTAELTGTLNGSNVGSYAAVTLPALTLTGEKADNYTLTRLAGAVGTSVTISKADALTPKTGDLAVANKQAHTYTYGLGALRPDLPAGMSFGSSAVTYELGAVSLGSYYGGSGAKIEGQTLTLPIQAVESDTEGSIGTITVIIHTGNFEDMTATIHVRSVNKALPTGTPTLSAATLTYGQPLSAITLSGSMKDGSADVPGTFTWSSPDDRPAVQEKYAAAWTFKPDDNDTYAIVTGTVLIQILPAPITGAVIVLEPAAFRYDGAAHRPSISSVTLSGITLTAGVDYTAQIPEGTEAGTYTVTLTGKGSYTGTATAAFTVNSVEQKPLDQTDNDGHELRLEVETGLSTVPEALKTNTKYDTPAKIEAELRTQVEQDMSNVGENIAVFDVTLQYKDESGIWHNVDPNNFPAEGVTAILPYPAGTGATGYTFTVQHLISSGTQAGRIEPLSYTLTADGLQCKFLSLSPVAIGYQAVTKPPSIGGGGGGIVSTYAVTIEKSEHGKVTSDRTNAGNGSTVTLTVTPDTGYVLDTLTVTDSRGNEVRLTVQGDGKYTFTMPGRAVTVKAVFVPTPDGAACDGGEGCPSRGFTDLGSVGTWYHEAVDYVLRNDLMDGYGNGLFGPDDTLTRAQFAQILFNKEGKPVVNYLLRYGDVAAGAWYTEAVRWATSQGIVGGYGNGMFGPNDNITREQLAVMLWRYAGSPAATDRELHFADADRASDWALDALRWATESGIIKGKGGGILDPSGQATRAETGQMLKNFMENQ